MTLFKKNKELSLLVVCMHCTIKYIHNQGFVLLDACNISTESTEVEVKHKPNKDKGIKCHCYYVLIYNSYTGVTLLYTGMMYHEKKEVNEFMTTFSVVRDLEVLQQVSNVI